MTPVICFMTSILFCRSCFICDGNIQCPWLSPHDEANCLRPCPFTRYTDISCDCNKLGNMTCAGKGGICYYESRKLFVFFYFCNVTMTNFGNVTIAIKLNKVSFVLKNCLIVTSQLFL